MPKHCYVPRNFSASSLAIVEQANTIIETYTAQGYDLTLRQLYYQFVSRNIHHNGVPTDNRLESLTVQYFCGAAMQLVVTSSPLSNEPWEFLLVERCLAGHLAHVQGVLQGEHT